MNKYIFNVMKNHKLERLIITAKNLIEARIILVVYCNKNGYQEI